MSFPEFMMRYVAQQVKPVVDALFYAFGNVLLWVAIIIAVLLFIDWLVQRGKAKSKKPKVAQPVEIPKAEYVKPVIEEKPVVVIPPPPPPQPVAVIPVPEKEIIAEPPAPIEEPVISEQVITQEESVSFSLQQDVDLLSVQFRKKCEAKNLTFITEVDDRLPEKISGRKHWLNDLIELLFTIGLKQTTQGSITLKIKMVKANDKNATLQLLVTDTGGLPATILRAVQEKDYAFQIEDELLETILMQLHEIKKSIEQAGGRLTLAARAGQGSTIGALVEVGL